MSKRYSHTCFDEEFEISYEMLYRQEIATTRGDTSSGELYVDEELVDEELVLQAEVQAEAQPEAQVPQEGLPQANENDGTFEGRLQAKLAVATAARENLADIRAQYTHFQKLSDCVETYREHSNPEIADHITDEIEKQFYNENSELIRIAIRDLSNKWRPWLNELVDLKLQLYETERQIAENKKCDRHIERDYSKVMEDDGRIYREIIEEHEQQD